MRFLADSSLPQPKGTPHIGTALFHARTAVTGVDLVPFLVAFALFCVLAAGLLAIGRYYDERGKG